MLSYRHQFHAGNFADILKHLVLVEILLYLRRKEKPFDYIDTHAGAGLYGLNSREALKTGEYREGIGLLEGLDWPELEAYLAAVANWRKSPRESCYPGSPAIAMTMLRTNDKAWLYELHRADFTSLNALTRKRKNVRVSHSDGFAGLLGVVPPASRRALILVDPSYEVKSDYRRVVDTVVAAHRKFATGIYAVWYPVISRSQAQWLEHRFGDSGIRKIDVYELARSRDSEGLGMTSSCMLVINPPWGLREKLASLLPRLAQVIGVENEGFSRVETLVSE